MLRNKGMTLIELITTMAILATICVPISMFLYSIYKSSETGSKYLEAENQARQIMYNIKEDLGMYEGIETSVTNSKNLIIGPNTAVAGTYKVNYYEETATNPGLYRKLIKNGTITLENRKIISSNTGSIRLGSIKFSEENNVIYIELTVRYGMEFGDTQKDFTVKSGYRKKVLATPTP